MKQPTTGNSSVFGSSSATFSAPKFTMLGGLGTSSTTFQPKSAMFSGLGGDTKKDENEVVGSIFGAKKDKAENKAPIRGKLGSMSIGLSQGRLRKKLKSGEEGSSVNFGGKSNPSKNSKLFTSKRSEVSKTPLVIIKSPTYHLQSTFFHKNHQFFELQNLHF